MRTTLEIDLAEKLPNDIRVVIRRYFALAEVVEIEDKGQIEAAVSALASILLGFEAVSGIGADVVISRQRIAMHKNGEHDAAKTMVCKK